MELQSLCWLEKKINKKQVLRVELAPVCSDTGLQLKLLCVILRGLHNWFSFERKPYQEALKLLTVWMS